MLCFERVADAPQNQGNTKLALGQNTKTREPGPAPGAKTRKHKNTKTYIRVWCDYILGALGRMAHPSVRRLTRPTSVRDQMARGTR